MIEKKVNLNGLKEIAIELSIQLKPNTVILLQGDLGAGKTTFTKFLVKALSIDTLVQSPSFVIMMQYNALKPKIIVNHFDFYRLIDSDNIRHEVDELSHYFSSDINIIEWPLLPITYYQKFCASIVTVNLEIINENNRTISITRREG